MGRVAPMSPPTSLKNTTFKMSKKVNKKEKFAIRNVNVKVKGTHFSAKLASLKRFLFDLKAGVWKFNALFLPLIKDCL